MTSSDVFKQIQPDLLTHEELVSILRERGVESGLLSQSKESLVSLYNRVALPLPQREFRQNYRGSLLMKKRRKRERIIIGEDLSGDKKSFTIGVSEPGTSSKSDPPDKSVDRLKPPPVMINYEKRKILLNSSGSKTIKIKSSSKSSDLDKVVIKKRKTSEGSCSEDKQNAQVDKESKSESISLTSPLRESSEKRNATTPLSKEECNGKKVESPPKKILLKRNNLTLKNSPDESSYASSSTAQEPKRKRKPITWP